MKGTTHSITDQTTTTALLLKSDERPSKLVFYLPLITAVTTLTLLLLAVSNSWLGRGAHVGTRFGEVSRSGLIKQPANTYSSLGFVFTGLLIGWRLKRGVIRAERKKLTQKTVFLSFFASLVVCLGPGSMAMHATETSWGGRLDLLSMYMVAGFLAVYAVWRFLGLARIWFSLLFGVVVGFCFAMQDAHYSMPLIHNFGDFIFGALIAVGALFEALNSYLRKLEQDFKWAALSLGVLLGAFLIWNLSLQQPPSRSLMQGHAVWHLLCAVAAYCLFRFYVSERARVASKDWLGKDRLPGLALVAAVMQPAQQMTQGSPTRAEISGA